MTPFKALALLALCLAWPQEAAKNPDLVAHFKFDDDKASKEAADASGNGLKGILIHAPAWTEGRKGGALKFEGKAYVEIPNTAALENLQEGSYSLAAWFKPENAPPGQDADNTANYAIVTKPGWHTGLRYTNEQKFVMEHWLATDNENEPMWAGTGTWETSYEPGKWYHIVGVVDRPGGVSKIYVDGQHVTTGEWEAGKKAREYEQIPWRIGIANPGSEQWSWPAKGLIDDVRLYKKALSDAEVEAIFKEGK